MGDSQKNSVTTGSIKAEVLRLGIPACTEEILLSSERLAEAFWIGHLGHEYLAAMSIGSVTLLSLRAIGQGVRVAGQTLLARYVGAGDWHGASSVAGQILAITVAYSLCITSIGYIFSAAFMHLFSSDPKVIEQGTHYLHAGFIIFGLVDLNFALAHLVRGAGESGLALMGIAVATGIGILGMPLLTIGAFGIESIGIVGVIYSLGVGRIAGSSFLIVCLASGYSRLQISPSHLIPRPKIIRAALHLSWPISVQSLLERSARVIILRIIAILGTYPVAAYGVVQRIGQSLQIPAFGIRAALRTFVGQNLGAGMSVRARNATTMSLKLVVAIIGTVASLLFVYAEYVAEAFGLESEGAAVFVTCLRILLPGLLLESCQQVFEGAFQGASRSLVPMLVAVIAGWGIRMPLAYVFSVVIGWGAPGIWWAIAASQVIGSLSLAFWFMSTNTRVKFTVASPISFADK